ncbi:M23 family metallopeptidase [Ningiella sp. W23]|uniref:M23 family metallopeptidase n=1 Tax=Ningiella sp. W23 TaxID=3023715 RepID=UPI0037579DA5
MRYLWLFVCTFILWGCNDSEELREVDTIIDSTKVTSQFFNGNTDYVWDRMSEQLRRYHGSKDNFRAFQQGVISEHGGRFNVDQSEFFKLDQVNYYDISGKAQKQTGQNRLALHMSFTNKNGDKLLSLDFRETSIASILGDQTYAPQNTWDFPFEGEYLTWWGSNSHLSNANVQDKSTAFGLNFVKIVDGRHFIDSGRRNSDYYCWGRSIFAPQDGTIVGLRTDLKDNEPGQKNPDSNLAHGNFVVIDHGNSEFSVISHLQQNSVTLKLGYKVKKGSLIGACGNSGSTPFPQIRMHLQDSSTLSGESRGKGLPIKFESYYLDGKEVKDISPKRGSVIEPII